MAEIDDPRGAARERVVPDAGAGGGLQATLGRAQSSVACAAELIASSGGGLAAALAAAAAVEDLARALGHVQLVAAHAVAEAHEREVEGGASFALGVEDGPLTFGADARLGAGTGAEASQSVTSAHRRDCTDTGATGRATSVPDLACGWSEPGTRGRSRRRRPAYRSAADALRVGLRLSGAEARRRVAAAADLLPRVTITGAELPVRFPGVAGLVAEGSGDPDAVRHILRGMRQVDRAIRAAARGTGTAAVSEQSPASTNADDTADRDPDPDAEIAEVEAILTDAARQLDADDVHRLVDRCVHLVDQDGPAPSEAELSARQGVFFDGRRHGLTQIRILTDDVGRELLETVFATGTNPRGGALPGTGVAQADDGGSAAGSAGAASKVPDGARSSSSSVGADSEALDGVGSAAGSAALGDVVAGGSGDADGSAGAADSAAAAVAANEPSGKSARTVAIATERPEPDRRPVARRRLDALFAACGAALRSADLPETGGLPTQVMVTVDLDALRSGLGSAQLPYTGPVPVHAVRRLACDAGITPIVLSSSGAVLDVGRTKRLFRTHVRKALIARDGGCAFPGCHIPATWCEGHHVVPWWNDGATSLDNAVLLCPYHHHLVHEGHWSIVMRSGLPWFRRPDAGTGRGSGRGGPLRNAYHRPPLPPRRQ